MRMADEQWSEVLRTNLDGAFYVVRRATPGHGAGPVGPDRRSWARSWPSAARAGQANYAAAKAGLVGLTRAVARELGSRGITANLVAPGPIATAMTDALTDERKAQMTGQVPLGGSARPRRWPPWWPFSAPTRQAT